MKKLIALMAGILIMPTFVLGAVFTDINSDHPNYQAINYLYEKGVINGYSDNSFRPDKKVNRAEALKIILLGSDIFVPNIQEQEVFPDVLSDAWYGKFASKAKKLKIVKGDADTGFFRPGDTVNLAEALKMLLKTNKIKTITPSDNPFIDVDVDAWYAPYFSYAKGSKLIDPSIDETVNPSSPITRGLLAELMFRLNNTSYIEPDGEASYYGEKFHGKTTASGEIFDASAFTAAHRSFPFGTWLKVTNVANGKSTKVRVNDRGPYAGENRIIDLSKAAFEAISSLSAGVINVALEVTTAPDLNKNTNQNTDPLTEAINNNAENSDATDNKPSENIVNKASNLFLNTDKQACPSLASIQSINVDFFNNITLDKEVPTRLMADEVLTLTGTTGSTFSKVTAFVVDSKNEQISFSAPVKDNKFTVHISFPSEGNFKIGILPGVSGNSLIRDLTVVGNNCIEERENDQLTKLSAPTLNLNAGNTVIKWNKEDFNLFKLTIAQDKRYKSYILHDINEWTPYYSDFKDFNRSKTEVYLRGAKLNANSIFSPNRIEWSEASKAEFTASTHEEYIVNTKEVDVISLSEDFEKGFNIEAKFRAKVPVRSNAAIILSNGEVKEIEIKSTGEKITENITGIKVYKASGSELSASYRTESSGVHFFEVNNDQGLAVINVAVYPRGEFPLIPNQRDLYQKRPSDMSGTLSDWRNTMLDLINIDRGEQGMPKLKLDDKLNALAQYRSDDMAKNNYFSHWNQQGKSSNDIRSNFGIVNLVGENLAKDLNIELAQYGLMRSAIHRSNILSTNWSRIGIGITKANDGTYLITQIFSDKAFDLSNLDGLRQRVIDTANSIRTTNINPDDNLNNVAQAWSKKMTTASFFSFTEPNGNTLVDDVRASGVTAALGTYILGNSSFSNALEQLKDNEVIKDDKWKSIGVGIEQDKLGLINITLIYTE